MKVLFSNLRDFLTERPVKVKGGNSDVFSNSGFGTGVRENLSEFFKSAPRGATRSEISHWHTEFGSAWQNVRDLISPRKLPPLQTTSQPVDVPEIWSKNHQFTRVQALSIAFHVAALAIILGPLLRLLSSPPTSKATSLDTSVSVYMPKMPPAAQKAGGGGGANNKAPAVRGQAPKFATQQFTPPLARPLEHPQMPMTPTLLGNPAITPPNINANNYGDPLSHLLGNDSLGSGKGTGIGNGDGGGLGDGYENGMGGGHPAGTGGYGTPACLYCPQAQFSDEAVKAKYQGSVLVSAVITADGRVTDVRVVKGLGLGLDENAVAAVKTWRFRPALGPDGKPATVRQTIEVIFHLY